MDALSKMLELARDGCTVTLDPSPVGSGVRLSVDLGDIHSRQLIPDHELDLARLEHNEIVSFTLEKIMRDVGDLLERELRDE